MRVKRGLAAHRRHKKYLDMAKGLAQAGVALNSKVLADLAVRQKEDFAKLVELAKTKLA